jgi:HD domain
MSYADWAETTARKLLAVPLPRRWAHSRGVAATAQTLASVLGDDADMLIAAAWLHDIGYAPGLHDTGFHPLDGARYLRDVEHAAPMLCRLVAHHSCALIEATERGIAAELLRDFEPAPTDLADALIYSDITTGPSGERLTVQQRLTEIRSRYGRAHVVSRAAARAAPELTAAVSRVRRRLAMYRSTPRAARLVPALAGAAHPM